MNRLQGKTAIITGGNSGVGAATAMLFAKEGANVVISARRQAALEEVAAKIKAEGGKVLTVPTDISKNEDCVNLVKAAVDAFGKLDILVNNAGVLDTGLKAIDKYLDSDVERILSINEVGTMQCMRAALAVMGEGASIVNVASVAGTCGSGGAVYVASKAALLGLTKHTAMLFADKHIRCNAVCPGNIITPMTSNLDYKSLDMTLMGALNKHGDMSLPSCSAEDVGNIILFLASDEAKPLTGQILVSDYGVNL